MASRKSINNELFRRWREEGDKSAYEALARSNMPLVHGILRRYRSVVRDYDELTAAGYEGLARAIVEFDPARSRSFATFATRCIRNVVLEAVNNARDPFGARRSSGTRANQAYKLASRLAGSSEPTETIRAFMKEYKTSAPTVLATMQARTLRMGSMDAPLVEGGDTSLLDVTTDSGLDPEQQAAGAELHRHVQVIIEELAAEAGDPRVREVLERIVAGDETDMTLKMIGAKYGCTRERIRQIAARWRTTLHERLAAIDITDTRRASKAAKRQPATVEEVASSIVAVAARIVPPLTRGGPRIMPVDPPPRVSVSDDESRDCGQAGRRAERRAAKG